MALETLMRFTVDYLKLWLMIVCQGQIMMDRRNLMQDKFSMSKTLQQLIRISHEVSEEEGQRYLDLAVEEE